MSTRSLIGIIYADGSGIDAIWAHYDGYPAHMGRLLLRHYRSLQSVKKLLADGDIEGLNDKEVPRAVVGQPLYFDDSRTGITAFRGNADKRQDAFNEMLDAASDAYREFIYLWDEKTAKWLYIDLHSWVTPREFSLAECEV